MNHGFDRIELNHDLLFREVQKEGQDNGRIESGVHKRPEQDV